MAQFPGQLTASVQCRPDRLTLHAPGTRCLVICNDAAKHAGASKSRPPPDPFSRAPFVHQTSGSAGPSPIGESLEDLPICPGAARRRRRTSFVEDLISASVCCLPVPRPPVLASSGHCIVELRDLGRDPAGIRSGRRTGVGGSGVRGGVSWGSLRAGVPLPSAALVPQHTIPDWIRNGRRTDDSSCADAWRRSAIWADPGPKGSMRAINAVPIPWTSHLRTRAERCFPSLSWEHARIQAFASSPPDLPF
jgi:hypothetical protein